MKNKKKIETFTISKPRLKVALRALDIDTNDIIVATGKKKLSTV